MNQTLIENYNAIVKDSDTCYFIGDICMGQKAESLALIQQLKGQKILIAGNHDSVFRCSENPKAQGHLTIYQQAGFNEIHDQHILDSRIA